MGSDWGANVLSDQGASDLVGHLRKVDPNENGNFGTFSLCEVVCERGGLSVIYRGGIPFGGLGLQGRPDGSSVRNIFEGSFTEEGMGSGNDIFERKLIFSASEARNNTKRTDLGDQRVIGERLGSKCFE